MSDESRLKLLVIRRDNIGDLVCTTPLLAGIRQRYPEALVSVLVNSYNRDVLADNPDVDEIHAYTKSKHRAPGVSRWQTWRQTWRLLMRLREERFDYAILATPGYQKHDLLFARLAGVRRVLGFLDRPGQGLEIGVIHATDESLHQVEDVWRLAAPMNIEGPPPDLKVVAQPARVQAVRQAMAADVAGVDARQGPLVALHLSARKPSQRWPAERFAAFARRLHEQRGAAFVLLWSPGSAANPLHPGDDHKAAELARLLEGLPVHRHATGELAELIAALAACDAVVCSDGGAMHLAAGLGKPIVCFFGQSAPERWRPWHARHELLQAASREASDISVEQALQAFDRLCASEGWIGSGSASASSS
jgi:ADP-heptose:LPS heptosyltransferase